MEAKNHNRFSYVSRLRSSPFIYDTVINIFLKSAMKYPDEEIFIKRDIDGSRESITYSNLRKESIQLAKFLISKGIRKGDHVALFGPNTIEWVIGELAIIIAGGIVVHMTSSNRNASDMYDTFNQTNCRALLIDPGKRVQFNELIFHLVELFQHLQSSGIQADVYNPTPLIIFLRKMEEMSGYTSLENIMEHTDLEVQFPTLYPEDDICVYETSGSTGNPKMIARSHFIFLNTGMHRPETKNFLARKYYNDRPFAWTGGSPLVNLCREEPRVFTNTSVAIHGKDAGKLWNIIKTENCAYALLMPYVLDDLIHAKDNYKDSFQLEAIATSGNLLGNQYTKVVGVYTETLIVLYALTEMDLVSIGEPLRPGEYLQTGNVGHVIPGQELKVVDQNGCITMRGTCGEICVRSGTMFKGYYKNEGATKKSFLPGKWFKTGDVGYIKEDDTVVIEGRLKDIISRGTRKIMPTAVEDVILQMEEVIDVVVIGVPDKRLHDEVCACFVAKEGSSISEKDVENFCNGKMAKEQSLDCLGLIPKFYLKFEKFPRLLTGKLDKRNIKLIALQRLKLTQ